jgi:hypothetical protein
LIPATNPVIELKYVPVVPASVVLLLTVVGLGVVLQQTPLAVIVAPPSAVTFPPLVAVADAMDETVVVVTVGRIASVVNETSVP